MDDETINILHFIIDRIAKERDIYLSAYFGRYGTSVDIYPYPEEETQNE